MAKKIKKIAKPIPKVEVKQEECAYCGCKETLYLTKDHIIAKANGGKDISNNIQSCCIVCNQIKANRTDEEFRAILKHLRGLKSHKLLVMHCTVTFGMHNHTFIKEKGKK